MRPSLIIASFILAASIIVASCDKVSVTLTGKAKTSISMDTTVLFPSDGAFTLDVANCIVTLTGGPEGEAKFHMKKIVRAPSAEAAETHLSDIKLGLFPMGRGYKLEVKVPLITNVAYYLEMEAQLPASTKLNLNSLHGDVDVSGFRSEINMKHVSGEINIDDCEGACNIKSLNGIMEIDNVFPKDLRSYFETSNGFIQLIIHEGTDAYLHATTTTGTIDADDDLPLAKRSLSAKSLGGVLGNGSGQIRIITGNAPIKLKFKKANSSWFE